MFAWIVLSGFMLGGAYSICAPILPREFEKKEISGLHIGIIFAMYSVGSIFWAPVVGKYLIPKVGAINLLCGSIGLMGSTFIMFGLLELIENRTYAIAAAVVIRLFQGMTGASHWTTC